ncbi:MAG: DUF2488 family protein [Synechococcaceae cyanobacterium SM2_3_1]|nr:DUF2488 family protein [Synechococcaceae cyanobacterium SM2_3_1]
MVNDPQPYFFVAASQEFLESEPLQEVLEERTRHYSEHNKTIDFAYVVQPAFLSDPSLADIAAKLPQPAAAVISTDEQFIRWLTIRLTLVETGQFQAPTATVPDPYQSLQTV